MNTTLKAIRDLALGLRAWNSHGTTFDNRVRDAVNLALAEMAGDAPELLLPREEHLVLLPQSTTDADGVVVNATSDPRVLRLTDTSGTELGASTLTTWRPAVDRTWDGSMWLEVEVDGGARVVRRQGRHWWDDGNVSYFVTIDRPWPNSTDALMPVRIHQREVFTRPDVMKVLNPVEVWDSTRSVFSKLTAKMAADRGYRTDGQTVTGRPVAMTRTRRVSTPTPTPRSAPTVGTSGTWSGEVAGGAFEFCYTVCLGGRDREWQHSPTGLADPLWESAPSPVSDSIDNSASGAGIAVGLPNLSAVHGVGSSTLAYGHTGFYKRLYVRRKSVASGVGTLTDVEADDRFYALALVNDTDTSFVWDGTVAYDVERPLVRSTGYFAWEVYPVPDKRYELDMRVLASPPELVDDQDVPQIHEAAMAAFVQLVLSYLSLMDGADQQSAAVHRANYNDLISRARDLLAGPGDAVYPEPLDAAYNTPVLFDRFTS